MTVYCCFFISCWEYGNQLGRTGCVKRSVIWVFCTQFGGFQVNDGGLPRHQGDHSVHSCSLSRSLYMNRLKLISYHKCALCSQLEGKSALRVPAPPPPELSVQSISTSLLKYTCVNWRPERAAQIHVAFICETVLPNCTTLWCHHGL